LADLGLRVRERVGYESDFTDGWQHDVRVEQILPLDPRRGYPVCIGGRRAPGGSSQTVSTSTSPTFSHRAFPQKCRPPGYGDTSLYLSHRCAAARFAVAAADGVTRDATLSSS